MALYQEDYSISAPRTGGARVFNLSFQGWGNDPQGVGVTEAGRMYWKFTTVGKTIGFYNDENTSDASKLMMQGSVVNGVANMTPFNGSGVQNARVEVAGDIDNDAFGDAIIFYADEPDLRLELKNVDKLLDGSSQWEGQPRFEAALKRTKRDLDAILIAKLGAKLRRNPATGEPLLTSIAKPRALATVHALMTCALLMRNRAGVDASALDRADEFERRAREKRDSVILSLDFNNDDQIDADRTLSGGRIVRG